MCAVRPLSVLHVSFRGLCKKTAEAEGGGKGRPPSSAELGVDGRGRFICHGLRPSFPQSAAAPSLSISLPLPLSHSLSPSLFLLSLSPSFPLSLFHRIPFIIWIRGRFVFACSSDVSSLSLSLLLPSPSLCATCQSPLSSPISSSGAPRFSDSSQWLTQPRGARRSLGRRPSASASVLFFSFVSRGCRL